MEMDLSWRSQGYDHCTTSQEDDDDDDKDSLNELAVSSPKETK